MIISKPSSPELLVSQSNRKGLPPIVLFQRDDRRCWLFQVEQTKKTGRIVTIAVTHPSRQALQINEAALPLIQLKGRRYRVRRRHIVKGIGAYRPCRCAVNQYVQYVIPGTGRDGLRLASSTLHYVRACRCDRAPLFCSVTFTIGQRRQTVKLPSHVVFFQKFQIAGKRLILPIVILIEFRFLESEDLYAAVLRRLVCVLRVVCHG